MRGIIIRFILFIYLIYKGFKGKEKWKQFVCLSESERHACWIGGWSSSKQQKEELGESQIEIEI